MEYFGGFAKAKNYDFYCPNCDTKEKTPGYCKKYIEARDNNFSEIYEGNVKCGYKILRYKQKDNSIQHRFSKSILIELSKVYILSSYIFKEFYQYLYFGKIYSWDPNFSITVNQEFDYYNEGILEGICVNIYTCIDTINNKISFESESFQKPKKRCSFNINNGIYENPIDALIDFNLRTDLPVLHDRLKYLNDVFVILLEEEYQKILVTNLEKVDSVTRDTITPITKTAIQKNCSECKKVFTSLTKSKKYCSGMCKKRAANNRNTIAQANKAKTTPQ